MQSKRGNRAGSPLPPRKPAEEHKHPLSVTVEPENRRWLVANFKELGFRNMSHAIDVAIGLLRERTGRSRREG